MTGSVTIHIANGCTYWRESLNKFNKPNLLASLQSNMDSVNSDLVAELRNMREGFD